MRFILFLCLSCLFLNCEDKQSKQKSNTKAVKTDTTKVTATNTLPERKYPKLTDENAMDFFLEYDKKHKENKVRLVTDKGDIEILLFDETKYHRANFIFLIKQKYFDRTQFHRVINNFMIQGGSSDDMETGRKRGNIGRYLLPADTKRGFKHDRGVISMPSSEIDNPHKQASPYEFFIVQQHGGSHFLDGDYTIFGRVTKGMDVVDKIAAVETDEADWPMRNIYIKRAEIIE